MSRGRARPRVDYYRMEWGLVAHDMLSAPLRRARRRLRHAVVMRLSLRTRQVIALGMILALAIPVFLEAPWAFWIFMPSLLLGVSGWWWVVSRREAAAEMASPLESGEMLDAYVRRQSADWDARHGPDEEAEGMPDPEAWRQSLNASWENPEGEDDEGDDPRDPSRSSR